MTEGKINHARNAPAALDRHRAGDPMRSAFDDRHPAALWPRTPRT
jgi:hypothetical protein